MDETRPVGHRLAIPAIASAGAAVLHAAAAGIHADTVGLARLFIALAVAQGAVAIAGFLRADRIAAVALVGVNSAAALGWAATRLTGISWVIGLEAAERPGLADTIAATLALVAVAGAAATLANRSVALPPRAITSAAVLVGVLTVPGLADATTHNHVGHSEAAADDAHDHGADTANTADTAGSATVVIDDHSDHTGQGIAEGTELVEALSPALASGNHGGHSADDADGEIDHSQHTEAEHAEFLVETKPYDPELPIDLGGVDGVTLRQQAYAENLVAATVRDLPQWADLDAVNAAGFQSIGDGATGHEHYIQCDWIDDDKILDPDYPESLVFDPQPDGTKELVSAMYMMPSNTPIDEVPDFGGALMQWHVHGDLCFTDDPVAPKVGGLKPIGTACEPPLIDGTMSPMIHVWIRPHECGPFAALDGIGGGQVPDGEDTLCDEAHGAH